jgi:CubicO group peptidase (beta-lactamase class C family)
MRKLLTLLLLGAAAITNAQHRSYFPPRDSWEVRTPASMGINEETLKAAIDTAKAHEQTDSRDLAQAQVQDFWREPYLEAEGPFANRGDATGIIVYKGYIVATWGNPDSVEMTNSVTKSFLSTVVGVAVDAGLIHSVHDTVEKYMAPVQTYAGGGPAAGVGDLIYPFASPHNRLLTWDVMLRQTSDWEGTLWGKPDWADRPDGRPEAIMNRPRHAPGSVWKYNDVRVNALALAATNVWRKPLPQVLKEYIMDPIGASATWRWMGYRNAWIVIDGQPVQSVSGGGHWGGGMFINAYDMARFGLLTLHRGEWDEKRIISDAWVTQALTPTAANKGYGYMNWFLNTDKKLFPSAPADAFAHIGNGRNIIYVDPQHDLVIVARWIQSEAMMDRVIEKVIAALPKTQ